MPRAKSYSNMPRAAGGASVILTCFVLFCFLIAKQLAILKFLNYLKHATDRLHMYEIKPDQPAPVPARARVA
jgi:hypothetical protein